MESFVRFRSWWSLMDNAEVQSHISYILNWYRENQNDPSSREYVIDYLKKEEIDNSVIERVQKEIFQITKPPRKPKITIKESMKSQLSEHLARIENMIEDYLFLGEHPNFEKYLEETKLHFTQLNAIRDFYETKMLVELTAAYTKTDSSCVEAYEHLSDKLKSLISIVNELIFLVNRYAEVSKQQLRKPRKKKVKTAIELIKKIKYKTEGSLIAPEKIIGAHLLIVFNTKTRFVGMYYSLGGPGLSMKGTTLLNFDTKNSLGKKLRKPKEQLETFLNMKTGKTGCKNRLHCHLAEGVFGVDSEASPMVEAESSSYESLGLPTLQE